MKTVLDRLAELADQAGENIRTGVELSPQDDPSVTPDWNYRLPAEYVDVRRDRLEVRI